VTRLTIEFEWDLLGVVATDGAGRVVMPAVPDAPGLYRFWAETSPGHAWVHVGETQDIRERLAGYARPDPTRPTDIRVNRRLLDLIAAGSRVMVWTIVEAWTRRDDAVAQPLDLRRHSQRLIVETAVALAAREDDRSADGDGP
jgi:hypothetical protein